MGAGDPPEQNANGAERHPRPHVVLFPLVQGTGASVLGDTLKGIHSLILPDNFCRKQMEYCANSFVYKVLVK